MKASAVDIVYAPNSTVSKRSVICKYKSYCEAVSNVSSKIAFNVHIPSELFIVALEGKFFQVPSCPILYFIDLISSS